MAEQVGGLVRVGAPEQAPYHNMDNLRALSGEKRSAGNTTYLGLAVVLGRGGDARGVLGALLGEDVNVVVTLVGGMGLLFRSHAGGAGNQGRVEQTGNGAIDVVASGGV